MSGADSLPLAVVRAIAAVDGVEPHELGYSLHDYVATDAIHSMAEMDHENWEVTFEVPDHVVTVDGTGAISVDGERVHESNAVSPDESR